MTPKPDPLAVITNPSFEQGLAGWFSLGVIEDGGHDGTSRLTHHAGKVESTQTVNNLENGWYTLKAWIRSSGGQKTAYISLKNNGDNEQQTPVPIAPSDKWLQVVVSAKVSNRQCTISLFSDTDKGNWVSFDDITLDPGRSALTILGADISSLIKSEDKGGIYFDEKGVQGDALKILHDHGINYTRLRVWFNSPDGYHGKTQILEMSKRLKAHHIKLLVDFHYSDSWADPGKQFKPKAWENLDFESLKSALYEHTFDICRSLNEQGIPPDIVQIGNEITNGILWPDGKNDKSFDCLAALLKVGYQAVKDSSPSTWVMLHLDNGGNNKIFRWWFDNIIDQGVPFDLIGASYYPYWHGTLADLQNNLNDIAVRYRKDILLVETSYPFTGADADNYENIITKQVQPGYCFTPDGQAKFLADVMSIVRAVPSGHGLGVMWWDATWIAVPGNGWDPAEPASGNNWENQALFDYNNRPLPALDDFLNPQFLG
jgi:arabinogalactan endo-1,4-beta-galactosidase